MKKVRVLIEKDDLNGKQLKELKDKNNVWITIDTDNINYGIPLHEDDNADVKELLILLKNKIKKSPKYEVWEMISALKNNESIII